MEVKLLARRFIMRHKMRFINNNGELIRKEWYIFIIKKDTDLSYMFDECDMLRNVDFFDRFDTSNVIKMSGMFNACSSLISITGMSKLNTSNVIDMSYMFNGCIALMNQIK